MEETVVINLLRNEKFVSGVINSIDTKIENCFKMLNQSNDERIKSYGFDDGRDKINTVYVSDNEILTCIMKLEKLREDYFGELQDFKPKE